MGMKSKGNAVNYVMALFVVFVWSVTFISTKVLLRWLLPTEILIYRYVVAYLLFFAASPKIMKPLSLKDEISFFFAGLLGVTLYFLCENFALRYSLASNVSMLVTVSPMLTGIFAHFFTETEKITKRFAVGCVFGLAGVFLLVFNGHFILKLNPLGDLLAICAALTFAIYSIIIRNIDSARYSASVITRKSFFYALLTLVPLCFTPLCKFELAPLKRFDVMANLLFLGVCASAACFLLWNKVIWGLGAARANNLIYLIPPMTMIAAAVVLHERITVFAVAGGLLILAGVFISQKQKRDG